MIPTRRLVLCALIPLALGVAAVAAPAMVWPLLAVDVALALVALLDLSLGRGTVEVGRQVAEIQSVGRSFPVQLSVVNLSQRTLQLRITDDAPGRADGVPATLNLISNQEGQVTYDLCVDRRGQHRFGPVTVRWGTPLGLWERQRTLSVSTSLRVYPNFGQLRRYGLHTKLAEQRVPVRVRRRQGGESEFQRLRPYVSGDPYRHIDWKATARRREFVSREYGQESNQNLIFLLDCGRMMSAQCGDLTAFDHALNAAMMMGQVALRHGDRVGLLAFDHKVRVWLPPKGGARSGGRLIRGTYDLFPSLDEPDYAAAFRYLAHRVKRRSLVVLLTAVADEVNADLASSLVGALARRHLAMAVWLRDPDLTEMVERPAAARGDLYARCAAAEILGWREASLKALRRLGGLTVDCEPSELTSELLGRYLDVKARHLI